MLILPKHQFYLHLLSYTVHLIFFICVLLLVLEKEMVQCFSLFSC